jgi:hypothetical protein
MCISGLRYRRQPKTAKAFQLIPNSQQRCTHSLIHRQSQNWKTTASVGTTAVREIKRLRFTPPSYGHTIGRPRLHFSAANWPFCQYRCKTDPPGQFSTGIDTFQSEPLLLNFIVRLLNVERLRVGRCTMTIQAPNDPYDQQRYRRKLRHIR